jgi:hypothetical protein
MTVSDVGASDLSVFGEPTRKSGRSRGGGEGSDTPVAGAATPKRRKVRSGWMYYIRRRDSALDVFLAPRWQNLCLARRSSAPSVSRRWR